MPEKSKSVTQRKAQPSLADLAPSGIDGRLWVKTLKDNLLSSKNGEPTDAELVYFATVCHNSGLDASTRQIYGIYRNVKQKDGTYQQRLSIQTSIDGLRVIAERSGKYAGSDEPEFVYDSDVKISVTNYGTNKLVPNKARVSVIKLMGDKPYKTTRTANWADYYPGEREGAMWRKLPETMLAKVAEAQSLRAAFPNETSGLYIEEEMQQSEQDIDVPDAEDIKKAIAEVSSVEELREYFSSLPADTQKQVTELATVRAKELQDD